MKTWYFSSIDSVYQTELFYKSSITEGRYRFAITCEFRNYACITVNRLPRGTTIFSRVRVYE